MADDTLIKGWEVARRTCNGRERGPLRKAAREVNAIRNLVLEGKASDTTNHKYVKAIETLYSELAKAGEQDFDGMLGEALNWLQAQQTGELESRLPVPVALNTDQIAALERIRDYRFTNSPGHIGRAIDRDLRAATETAKEVRAGLAAMKKADNPEDLVIATKLYVEAADRFCAELAQAGEPDFDGLLRQAVLVLDSAPGMSKKGSITASHDPVCATKTNEGISTKGSKSIGKGGKRGSSSKGGGKYGDRRHHDEPYSSHHTKSYFPGDHWQNSGKGEPKNRRWHAKDSAWPDEASWGA